MLVVEVFHTCKCTLKHLRSMRLHTADRLRVLRSVNGILGISCCLGTNSQLRCNIHRMARSASQGTPVEVF